MQSEISVFCENISKLRKIYKLSKREMARILGISTKSLTFLENGTVPPRLSVDILDRILTCFGILPADIFKKLDLNKTQSSKESE